MARPNRILRLLHDRQFLGVTLRVMAIMAVVEMAIMVFIEFSLPREVRHLGVFIDPFLLVVLGAPLIVFWVIGPYERERARSVAEANFVATHDPLTGLANRRLFTQFLDHSMAGARRRGHYGAVMVLDLDHLRQINDTFGHDGGDTVLVGVARHIDDELRGEDLLCRVGGDEFAVAVVHLGADRRGAEAMAEEIADKIRFAVRRPIPFDRNLLQVDASVGVSLFGPDQQSAEMALREAVAAVVRAKAAGRGRVVFAGADGQSALSSRAAMLAEIERDHLEIDALVDELILAPNHRLAALQQLADKVIAHLRFEDEVIARILGKAGEPHRQAHAELVERVEEAVSSATEETAARVGTDIHAWVAAHITDFDERLTRASAEGAPPP